MVETRRKRAMTKSQVNIQSAEGPYNTQTQSDDASLAPEQDPILTLVSTSDSSSMFGAQRVAYLTKAVFSASVTIPQTMGIIQPSLSRAFPASLSLTESDFDMPKLEDADIERNKENMEAVLEESMEDFSPPHSYVARSCSFMCMIANF